MKNSMRDFREMSHTQLTLYTFFHKKMKMRYFFLLFLFVFFSQMTHKWVRILLSFNCVHVNFFGGSQEKYQVMMKEECWVKRIDMENEEWDMKGRWLVQKEKWKILWGEFLFNESLGWIFGILFLRKSR